MAWGDSGDYTTYPNNPTSYTRGTIVNPDDGTTLNLGQIHRERIAVMAGLWARAIPATCSADQILAGVFGRQREIVIEGSYKGSMAQIEENFLRPILWWANVRGLQDKRAYFPYFHGQGPLYTDLSSTPANPSYINTWSNQATPTQRYFFYVVVDHFEIEYDERVLGKIQYLLVMREGKIAGGFTNS